MKQVAKTDPDVKRQQRENRLHQFLLDEMRKVLQTPSGRTVLARILGECEVNKSMFMPDGNQMYFHSGMRHMGVFVKGLVKEAAPRKFLELCQDFEKISNFFETGSEVDLETALVEAQARGRTETVEIKP